MTRDIDKLDQHNDLPTDLWSDGQRIWVINNAGSGADAIFAYDVVTGERNATSDFTLDSRKRFASGIAPGTLLIGKRELSSTPATGSPGSN